MKLTIYHETAYHYDRPIMGLASQMYLQPMNNERQILENFRLRVEPHTDLYQYVDRFGNHVHHFTLPRRLTSVYVTVTAQVLTTAHGWSYRPPRDYLLYESTVATRRAPFDHRIREWAGALSMHEPTRYGQVRSFNRAIYQHFRYESGVTTVKGTAVDFLEQGAGVCQDFAHFLLAVLRMYQIPALYVSGYFVPSEVAPTATHAWVMAYVGSGTRGEWVGFDPTTGEEITDRYVWLAIGRDYDDVTPVRGVYQGQGHETMEVNVHAEQ